MKSVICLHTVLNCQTVLFDSLIEPFQMQLLRVRVDQGAMAMKEYFTFPKTLQLELHHQTVWCNVQDTAGSLYNYFPHKTRWVVDAFLKSAQCIVIDGITIVGIKRPEIRLVKLWKFHHQPLLTFSGGVARS